MWFSVARVGDRVYTGHLCDTSTTIATGSPNVFVNKIAVARVNDPLAPHTIPEGTPPVCVPHPGQKVNVGSGKTYVNRLGVARVLDSADLGNISQGSPNVYSR